MRKEIAVLLAGNGGFILSECREKRISQMLDIAFLALYLCGNK
ncbi:hypothetical protein [Bacteroides sp.]|nr:hypothetical protein [Bacteroides sp.]MDD3037941.1 hypothetical protein [Bacteroides sp.]